MFFIASKTLDLLVDPLWWAITCMALAFWKGGKAARGWVVGALCIVVVAALPPVSNGLKWALEHDVHGVVDSGQTWDVVVLLGGAVDFGGATAKEVAWNGNVERLTVVYDLLRTGRAKRAILSGGVASPSLPSEAEYLQRQLLDWGIEPERLVVETKSQNTRDNAVFSKQFIEGGSTLVVTSAFHVPRAQGCFRAVGLEVDMLPVDFHMRAPRADSHWLPRAEYLASTTGCLREYLGRFVYRLMGYSLGP